MRAMPFKFATLFLFLILLKPRALQAQTPQALIASKSLNLEELTKEFQPILNRHFVSGQFHQKKNIKELEVTISSQGQFSIETSKAGDFIFHWNIIKPEPLEICMDTKQVVLKSQHNKNNQDKKIKEDRIQYAEMGEQGQKQLIEMVRLINFNPKQIYDSADILITLPIKNTDSKKITLIPKNQNDFLFQKAEIEVNKKGFINHLVMTEKSQDQLIIDFSKLESKAHSQGELSKNFFCP
jgi:hypothetical protein